jgi:hypothetical protein
VLGRSGSKGAAVQSHGVAGDTGLRRVDWVRLIVNHDHLRAEAVGVGFRFPAVCPIPLSTAASLIATGTPHVTWSDRPVDAGR